MLRPECGCWLLFRMVLKVLFFCHSHQRVQLCPQPTSMSSHPASSTKPQQKETSRHKDPHLLRNYRQLCPFQWMLSVSDQSSLFSSCSPWYLLVLTLHVWTFNGNRLEMFPLHPEAHNHLLSLGDVQLQTCTIPSSSSSSPAGPCTLSNKHRINNKYCKIKRYIEKQYEKETANVKLDQKSLSWNKNQAKILRCCPCKLQKKETERGEISCKLKYTWRCSIVKVFVSQSRWMTPFWNGTLPFYGGEVAEENGTCPSHSTRAAFIEKISRDPSEC